MFTPSQASRLRARKSKSEEALSRPDVGSSRNKSEGSMTISKPTFTRLRWPPEIPRFSTVPTKESRTSCSPRFSITLSTIRILSSFLKSDANLHRALNHKFSSTVKFPCTISSWGIKPVIFLYDDIGSLSPFMKMKPVALHPVVWPVKAERNDVFPAPEGPITAVIRPGTIFPLRHLRRYFRFCFS
uniref:Uncharacterized protein n=1 Tax=Opuntia streptacantha TaxID=393608 RepID=A0A7C8ZMD5_OPUST